MVMKRTFSNTQRSAAALATISPAMTLFPESAGVPSDRHPVATYLARLAPTSRRTMRSALRWIASNFSAGQADAIAFPWPELRHQHLGAIRQRLVDRDRAPSTANRSLSAVRGV